MSPGRLGGVALSAVALLAMAWCSDRPWTASRAEAAVVRVSIGARPERLEVCRTQSDEELARVAPQMRQRVVCEGASARYRLELSRNGQPLLVETLRGGGLRHDRPLYVFREFTVPPGSASYSLRLTRMDSVSHEEREADEDESHTDSDDADAAERETRRASTRDASEADEHESDIALLGDRAVRDAEQRRRRRASALPPDLVLHVDAMLHDRQVMLLTYDGDKRVLKAQHGDPE